MNPDDMKKINEDTVRITENMSDEHIKSAKELVADIFRFTKGTLDLFIRADKISAKVKHNLMINTLYALILTNTDSIDESMYIVNKIIDRIKDTDKVINK